MNDSQKIAEIRKIIVEYADAETSDDLQAETLILIRAMIEIGQVVGEE